MKNYFNWSEFRVTETGIPNHVDDHDVHVNLCKLRLVLNIVRGLVGAPIIINSAYRCKEVNEAVGGSKSSYHLLGLAADITCSRWSSLKSICKEFHKKGIFEECIIYENYIHIAI